MNAITSFAVRRYQFTLVVFLMLVALGFTSFSSIPKSEDPTFPVANFAIVTVLPGASPRDLEQLVVDPIETRLKALDDVKNIKTTIEDGLAVVRVEFTAGVDPGKKHDDVLREMTGLTPALPRELARLEVRELNASKVNIIELALVSDRPYRELEPLAKDLKRRLESAGGVDEVQLVGLPRQEVTIALDVDRLVSLGVTADEIVDAVGREARNLPSGSVEAGPRKFNVKTSGDYGSVEEVRATVVRSGDGQRLVVSDLADVTLGDEEATNVARFDGRRAVLVAANQKIGQNVFATQAQINAQIDAFARTLPPGVSLQRGFDQSKNVEHRLRGFGRDFALAICLVLLTLLPLGFRASLVVMISIPLSIAIGLFLLRIGGYSINQLSIVGFVIALGLLVDDSVVVVENIARFLREGHSPRVAAIRGTSQIAASVLGCTATLILAFVPLLALPGNSGQFIRSLPVTVVFTIVASLAVSLTVVPFLSSRLLRSEGEHGNVVLRGLTWLIEASYRPILARAVAWPKLTVLGAVVLTVASLALVPRIGFSLFPKAGIPQFLVLVEAAEGTSLQGTDRVARHVEAILEKVPEVRHVATTVGRGSPRIYYNVQHKEEKANVAELFVELDAYEPGRTTALLDRLRGELAYPGARIEVLELEQGPQLDAPVALRVLGRNPSDLEAAARAIENEVRAVPGTRDVKNESRDRKADVRVRVDRDKAAVYGVDVATVDQVVRLALAGVVVGKYHEDASEDARDIRVTIARKSTSSREGQPLRFGAPHPGFRELDGIYVPGFMGPPVPISQLASIGLAPSDVTIRHYDKERSVLVTAQVKTGFNTDRVTKEILSRLSKLPLPPGVRLSAAGEIASREESFGGLGAAIVIAIFGVLAVLVLEFRTFRATLIVASVIPLGVVGGLLALLVSGDTLSFTATIGFIALMGIEVKNSILLVDFIGQLRADGTPLDEAIRRAGELRFLPILLTTFTALGGLVPLALEGSALYSPLALVLIGGLVSSTFLARVVTPVLYKLMPPAVATADEDAPIETTVLHSSI